MIGPLISNRTERALLTGNAEPCDSPAVTLGDLSPQSARNDCRSALLYVSRAIRFSVPFFLAFLLVVTADFSAGAQSLRISVDCPDAVSALTPVPLNVQVENKDCSPRTLRLLSTMVGNGAETVGGISVIGPEIFVSSVVLPAATDTLSTTCGVGNFCEVFGIPCQSDADCVCLQSIPSEVTLPTMSPTSIPIEFAGTMMEQFVFADSDLDSTPVVGSCMIEVPEPGFTFSLGTVVVLGLFLFSLVGGSRRMSCAADRTRSA